MISFAQSIYKIFDCKAELRLLLSILVLRIVLDFELLTRMLPDFMLPDLRTEKYSLLSSSKYRLQGRH